MVGDAEGGRGTARRPAAANSGVEADSPQDWGAGGARVGVIGCGNISGIYLTNCRVLPALELVACADWTWAALVPRPQSTTSER